MTQAAAQAQPVPALTPIPLREIAPWALFGGVILLALLYLVGMDQGATSVFSGEMLHEFVHDGRHLLGFPLPLMVRSLLVRGMLAGLIGGLVAALFAWLFGEPSVDSAIAYEDALAAAAGAAGGEPLVDRGVQSTIGLAVGYLIYGVAVGGLLALAYSAALGRFGRLDRRGTVLTVALLGFGAGVLVPFLKYPANPPASSLDDTIGTRTGLFVIVVALSVGLAVAATVLARRLSGRLGWWNAVLAATGGYVVVIGLIGFLLPAIAETPADFPATVLYQFRLASLGGQLVLWTATALVLAELVDRAARPAGARRPAPATG